MRGVVDPSSVELIVRYGAISDDREVAREWWSGRSDRRCQEVARRVPRISARSLITSSYPPTPRPATTALTAGDT